MKKLISILLLLSVLLSVFASCAAGSDGKDDNNSNESKENAAETAENGQKVPNIEKQNYDKDFRMLVYENMKGSWFYAEKSEGEVLNDAIFEMNSKVADQLGIRIKYTDVANVVTGHEQLEMLLPSLKANDDEYQLVVTHPYYNIATFISQSYVKDFSDMPGIDLSRDYWSRDQMEALSVDGKMYMGLGDICSYTLNILYFNKKMLKDVGLEAPYQTVRNGDWTLDEFMRMTEYGYQDLNGDGKNDNKDRYGFACMWDANATSFQQACGIYTLTKDADGAYKLSLYSDKAETLFEKLKTLCKREQSYIWGYGDSDNKEVNMNFADGNILFTQTFLSKKFQGASFKYGILPLPKYDSEQEQYAHVNWGTLIAIPYTVQDEKMVGEAIELMAFYSNTIVQPAYYENVLGSKVSDTQDDWDMIQLIYDTVVFDPGIAFCDGLSKLWNLVYAYCFAVKNNNKSLSSYYNKNKKAQDEIDELLKQK